jgi:hypothetical protein
MAGMTEFVLNRLYWRVLAYGEMDVDDVKELKSVDEYKTVKCELQITTPIYDCMRAGFLRGTMELPTGQLTPHIEDLIYNLKFTINSWIRPFDRLCESYCRRKAVPALRTALFETVGLTPHTLDVSRATDQFTITPKLTRDQWTKFTNIAHHSLGGQIFRPELTTHQ